MDVSCPACAARYNADEAKLRGKTARMRCRACDTVWLVSGPPEERASREEAEEKRAAVRRGTERDGRDLFAPQSSADGVVRQTLRPPPPGAKVDGFGFGVGVGVAARNENSVLFTVDALRNAPLPTPPPSLVRAEPHDDEGMIDLNAMASSPPRMTGRTAIPPLFPSSDPPPAAFARDAGDSHPPTASTSRKGLLLGLAAALAFVFGGVGVAMTFRNAGPPPAVAVVTSLPKFAAVAPPKAEPAPTTATPVASSATEEDPKLAKKKGAKPGKAGKGVGKTPSANKPAAPAAPPPPPKAADPCNCKGNFDCVMRCAAKGK